MMLSDEDSVYRELMRKLGKEPQHDIWGELVEDDYVSDAIFVDGLDELVDRYRTLEKRRPLQRKPREKGVHEEPPDERLKYLSEILAYDAAKEPPVIDFRRDVLGDQLLSPDKVKNWIEDTARNEQSDNSSVWNVYLTVRIPGDTKLRATNRGLIPEIPLVIDKEGMITDERIELLGYAVPGDKWSYQVRVARNGILERLKRLSEFLHKRYTWQEEQATTFVLTGLIPLLPLAQSTLHLHSVLLYPALNTMTIKVSSYLSPKEVANIYSRARRRLMSNKQKRNRLITKKHLGLAVFYHTHQGMKWAEIMKAWNREQPGYKPYVQVTHFARDAKHAHDRLVGWANKGSTE